MHIYLFINFAAETYTTAFRSCCVHKHFYILPKIRAKIERKSTLILVFVRRYHIGMRLLALVVK